MHGVCCYLLCSSVVTWTCGILLIDAQYNHLRVRRQELYHECSQGRKVYKKSPATSIS